MELRFEGKVKDLRAALRRLESVKAGTLADDELGRRRYQRELRRAQLRSLARQILAGGRGDGPYAA